MEAQSRFTFGVKAAAYGCGISVRQLDWWTRVGYVPVLQTGRHRRYSANAVKIALLIRASMEQGLSLRRAAESARTQRPSLWDDSAPPPSEGPGDQTDELEFVRHEVTRLTSELAEIGVRLDTLIGPSSSSGAAHDMEADEDA